MLVASSEPSVKLPGQTLVETVAALAVTVIIITALVGMAVASMRSSNLSRSKAIAVQLLTEETERLRVYRDLNSFSVLKSDLENLGSIQACPMVTPQLYINSDQVIVLGTENKDSNNLRFQRSFTACLTAASPNDKVIEINAVVSWTDSSGTHPLKSTTYFSDWR